MTSLQQIAHIVRRKRTEADFSVAAIAAQAGVPVDVVQGLEALEPGISTAQLGRIAKALSLDLVALMNGEERSVPGSAVFLRHQAFQDFGETDREVAQVALRSALQFLELSDALSATGLRRDGSFKRREAGDNAAQDGYRLARTVRRTLKQPVDPLGDLRKLLEEHFELVVLVAKTSSSVTAMAVADLTGAAAVVLSAGDPERRKNPVLARVHLAHELCHVLFERFSSC